MIRANLNRAKAIMMASAAVVATPAMAQEAVTADAQDGQTTTDTGGRIEEIVVTAQKREQNLQDVPVSISAVTQSAIVANRVQDVSDLSAVTPNLAVRPGAGGSKIPQYSMRGIYTFGSAVGTDKGVSLYIDGVYIQNVAGSVFEFADIDRIEVLRGPQGTLFGRNSTGGAVSILTRNPTGKFGVRQELTYGNYNQFRSRTRVDLPQIGPFNISASYLHSERDGDVRNLGAGTVWDHTLATNGGTGRLTSPKRLGDENVEGVFVAVEADLHPDLDLSYKFDYSENDFTPGASGVSYLATSAAAAFGGTAPSTTANTFYNQQNAALRTPITRSRPKAVNNAFTQPAHTEGWGHNLTAKLRLTDEISIKNIFAVRKTQVYTNFQLDGLGGLVAPGGANNPFLFVANNSNSNEKQWSDELQLNINTDWFTLTAGLIHFHNNQRTGGNDGEFNTLQGVAVTGQNTTAAGTRFVIPANTGYQRARVKVNSDAVYVQQELHLTDRLDAVGGLRLTRDRKRGLEFVPGTIAAPSLGRNVAINYRDSRPTYMLGVNYKPVDNIFVFAKYATGYISGGQLATIAFAPETAKSYEAGIKTDLLDRRLRSNLALFHVKYSSIQQATLGSLTGIASAVPFGQAIVPSADGTAKGFEWENTLIPVRGLTLTANVGYTHFRFDDATVFPGFLFQGGLAGFNEFHRPKWTGNAAAQYELRDIVGGAGLTLRVDANYKSKTLLSADTSPGTGPTAQEDPAYRRALTAPEQWLINGRIALNDIDLGRSKATVALWGKNLTNNGAIVQSTSLGFAAAVIYERARTYGVDVTMQF